MPDTQIRITFTSDWHVGSGLGNGAVADAILVRDNHNIPYLPGRGIKGALREGAWRLGLGDDSLKILPDYIFGREEYTGIITVGNGWLPGDLVKWLLSLDEGQREQFLTDMTLLRAQTALDSARMAKPQSLRTIECGIPGLYFTANVSFDATDEEKAWLMEYLAAICAAVKSTGGYRARGMGQCEIRPLDAPAGPVKMPGQVPQKILKKAEAVKCRI